MKLLFLAFALGFCTTALGAYTHGVAGSFQKMGRVNWRGWGYWSKSDNRWHPLTPPSINSGTISGSQIVGTSDGGAIIVGRFTSINGRQAAGVAYYDVQADDWFPANEVGLYKVSGGPGNSPGTCRGAQGTGIDYLLRQGQTASRPLAVGSALTNASAQETLSQPVAVDPLTGRSDVVSSTNPVTQEQKVWHTSVGAGRAIVHDVATPDRFFVFGNFENVGLDVDAGHNRDLTAAGIVQFDYNPQTRVITPTALGYTARQRAEGQNVLHPRHCGHSGATRCDATNDGMTTFGCPSESPHNDDDGVQFGMTRGVGTEQHFFVQEPGNDIYRWTVGTNKWVNVVVNDDGGQLSATARTGTGQQIARLADAMTRIEVNIRTSTGTQQNGRSTANDPGDFKWMVSQDQSTLWIWRTCYPNTMAFGGGAMPTANDGSISGHFQFAWDDDANAKGYLGGMRSTDSSASNFASAYSDANLPKALYRDMPADPTTPVNSFTRPLRLAQGIRTGASWATAAQDSLILISERFPGSDTLTFQQNRYAHTQYLAIARINQANAAAHLDNVAGGPHFASGARPNTPAVDDNGNQKMPWDFQYNDIAELYRLADGDVYVRSTSNINYDPVVNNAHTAPASERRFKRRYSTWMKYTAAGAWEPAFGGGLDDIPRKFWSGTGTGNNDRVYVFTGAVDSAWNFLTQSGTAMYDDATHSWVDPLGSLRLVSYTGNWYQRANDAGSVWAEVGQAGSASIVHFQGSDFIIAGSFSFIGDSHYGSVVVWDGQTVGAGFRAAGSPTTGLYTQAVADFSQRWIEPLAGTDYNRKVGQGSVNCMTNNGNTLFVGGNFDRSSNDVATGNFLNNIAMMRDYTDTSATSVWEDVDGGCESSTIRQLIVFNGELYAGGAFNNCGRQSVGGAKFNIARINVAVGANDHWQSLGTGVQGDVYALVEWKQKLAVAGTFSSVDQSGYRGLAFWDGSVWSYPNTACIGVCQEAKLSLDAAAFNRPFLTSQMDENIRSLIATDVLWATIESGSTLESGATQNARELAYYDGEGWYRVSNGRFSPLQDSFNGYFAVNGTSGDVLVANGDLADGNMNNWWNSAGTGNIITVRPQGKNRPASFPLVTPGIHGADSTITHFAAASQLRVAMSVVIVLIAAVLM